MEILDSVKMTRLVGIILLMSFLIPNSLKATSLDTVDSCMQYKLSTDKTLVDEKAPLHITLEYKSSTSTCNFQAISGTKYTVDLSNLVTSGKSISVQADGDIFNSQVTNDGKVVLTYKNLVHPDETLTDFGGKVIFDVNVKNVNGNQTSTISDSNGEKVDIKIQDGDDKNSSETNMVSNIDYVKVGSVIDYTVAINENKVNVDKFLGNVKANSALEYVPNSFWAEEDKTWNDASDLFTIKVDQNNNFSINNNAKLTKTYLLHYQMRVTKKTNVYDSDFIAKYDQKKEITSDDVRYNYHGGGWSDYEHAKIKVQASDNNKQPLSDVQLEIRNSDNDVIETLKTNKQGVATSKKLAYGKYYVLETKVPKGYKLNNQQLMIKLDNPNQVANINISSEKGETKLTSNNSINKTNDKLVKTNTHEQKNNQTANSLANTATITPVKLFTIILIMIIIIVIITKFL